MNNFKNVGTLYEVEKLYGDFLCLKDVCDTTPQAKRAFVKPSFVGNLITEEITKEYIILKMYTPDWAYLVKVYDIDKFLKLISHRDNTLQYTEF